MRLADIDTSPDTPITAKRPTIIASRIPQEPGRRGTSMINTYGINDYQGSKGGLTPTVTKQT